LSNGWRKIEKLGEKGEWRKTCLPQPFQKFLGFNELLKGFSRLNPILTLNFPKVKEDTFLLPS